MSENIWRAFNEGPMPPVTAIAEGGQIQGANSPDPVVSEEMVEAAMSALQLRYTEDCFPDPDDMRAALTAALKVRTGK